jgi:hypothetical protein
LLGELWRSPQPFVVKVEGTVHLTHYAVHPLMIMNLLLILPLLVSSNFLLNIYPFFALAAIGPLFMYLTAMGKREVPFLRRLINLTMLVLLGMGLSLNNTRAVGEALIGKKTPFKRTPKYNLHDHQNGGKYLDYLIPKSGMVWLEALTGFYAAALLLVALNKEIWGLVLWLSFIAGGYTYTTFINFKQSMEEKQAKTVSPVGESLQVVPQATTSNPGQD